MIKSITVALVLVPAFLLLNACGAPDSNSLPKHRDSSTVAASVDQKANNPVANNSTIPTPTLANIADIQAKQDVLMAQKSAMLIKQTDLSNQKQSFAKPGGMNAQSLDNVLADVQAEASGDATAEATADGQDSAVGFDQAKIDAIIKAAQDMDLDALQKAIDDIVADIQKQIDDLQAGIDACAAQIKAAKQ